MKLPRWLVITMLATGIFSVLVAAGFWWVTWPGRIAMEFDKQFCAKKTEEYARLCESMLARHFVNYDIVRGDEQMNTEYESGFAAVNPTPWDIIIGKRVWSGHWGSTSAYFVVERGKVTDMHVSDRHGNTVSVLMFEDTFIRLAAERKQKASER
jgi:hypothetical protein